MNKDLIRSRFAKNLKTYDENGMLLKTENISNELSSLYTNITKIPSSFGFKSEYSQFCKDVLSRNP